MQAYAGEVLAGAVNRPVQIVNGGRYLRGLIEHGPRKSLEPLVDRLRAEANYESMQQFLAVSPWDPAVVIRAVAERVAGAIDVEAWVLDDTGFPKMQALAIGVSTARTRAHWEDRQLSDWCLAARGRSAGTVPLGWALYLPEEWCKDQPRREKAKIPDDVEFQTKPQLGVKLAVRAAGWKIDHAPVLGDRAYGDNTELRDQLHDAGLHYVLSVSPQTTVFTAETKFIAPEPRTGPGHRSTHPRPDTDPESIGQLVSRLGQNQLETVAFRDGPTVPR